ncbi:MAG: penicillin-binding protein activator [Deltaproteobacteria bacterium]|nr:penicillin-binding protein activator [Deltaproteobacteria bacterium]
MKRRLAGALFILNLALWCAAAHGQAPYAASSSDTVPVPRPAVAAAARSMPILPFWRAEREFQAGKPEEALSLFLDLAYNYPDDERKGFVWMRVGELLLARGDLEPALSAADKAILFSRARFLSLSAMDLKFRVYRRMQWRSEARQVAAYLLEQRYIYADPPKLLAFMARADAEDGRIAQSLGLYRRAVAAARTPEDAANIRAERDTLIDGFTDIPALREAAEGEEEAQVKAHLFLTLGKLAARKGFTGMGAFALEKSARLGGARGSEAAEQLYRLEKIVATRPKIVGLLPLSGKLGDLGFAVLSGAEVALKHAREKGTESTMPSLRWVDTGGHPERARREFLAGAGDKHVIGFLGPLTGEEGRSVGVAVGPKSPPVLYLGQKAIPEKPFLYGFGLSPIQEARAVLAHLQRNGMSNLLLLYPENGYGKGFSEAVAAAAKETGIRVSRSVSYAPDLKDFTDVIKKAVGASAFHRDARAKEKGKAMRLKQEAVVVADRWDRVFLVASQLRYYNVYLPLAGFSGWNDEELIRKAGDAVAGSVFSVDYADAIPGTQGERFRANFQEALRSAPSRFEAMGYDGAALLSEAYRLETGKEARTGAEASRDRIPRLKTFRGVTGTFQFGTAGDMRRKVFLLQVELGNFVPVPES